MKTTLSLLLIGVPLGGAVTVLALVVASYRYGNQPSATDMELAAELGAAIGGALTFTWPFRLLKR